MYLLLEIAGLLFAGFAGAFLMRGSYLTGAFVACVCVACRVWNHHNLESSLKTAVHTMLAGLVSEGVITQPDTAEDSDSALN